MAHALETRTRVDATDSRRRATAELAVAGLVVFAIAIRYRFSPDVPISFLISIAILPMTAGLLLRHRGAAVLAALALLAALSGAIITEARSGTVAVSDALRTVQTVRVLALPLVLASLLWARSVLGLQRLVLVFGLGSLASLAVTGVNLDNVWKFSFSVPVTLIVLSLPWVWASTGRQLLSLGALAAVSALADSRSLAAMLVIAAAIVLLERRGRGGVLRVRSAWGAIARLGVIAIAGYFAVQAAILEGVLGDAARARTELQIDRSGTAIVGGRPEMGAAASLIAERPLGYGSGALVTYDERRLGAEGMWALGYDPDNGYVHNYMFGNGLEVHSVLGDLWLIYGLAGAALALCVLLAVVASAGHGIASGAISAVALFLAIRSVWDVAFSPFASAMVTLPLALAVLLPALPRAVPRRPSHGRRQAHGVAGPGPRSPRRR